MEHIDNGLFIKEDRFEVLAILREIHKQRISMRITNEQRRFHARLLSVGADNIVFCCDQDQMNRPPGEPLKFEIESHDAKIEFSVQQVEPVQFSQQSAYMAQLPKALFYIQRRRQFRIITPSWRGFLCHAEHGGRRYVFPIHNLSAGGVGLRIDGVLPACIASGLQLKKAKLDLEEYGSFTVNMELVGVSEDYELDDDNREHCFWRLSWRFVNQSLAMERKLQSAVFALELDFNKRKRR